MAPVVEGWSLLSARTVTATKTTRTINARPAGMPLGAPDRRFSCSGGSATARQPANRMDQKQAFRSDLPSRPVARLRGGPRLPDQLLVE